MSNTIPQPPTVGTSLLAAEAAQHRFAVAAPGPEPDWKRWAYELSDALAALTRAEQARRNRRTRSRRACRKRARARREAEAAQLDAEKRLQEHRDALTRQVLAVIAAAHPGLTEEERTIALADALKDRDLMTMHWCAECEQSERDSGKVPGAGQGCASHATTMELADAYRRVAYRRLPGSPRIEVDL